MKIKAFKPFPHQRAVIDVLESNPNSGMVVVVKSSRQKGKSLMMNNILFKQAVNYPGSVSFFISPTNSQCRKQYRQMAKVCTRVPGLIESANGSFQDVEFKNGSMICYRSAASGDNLRGNTVTKNGLLVFDEASFINDEIIYDCFPFTDVSNANIVLVSTPKFKKGAFYDHYMRALNNDPHVKLVDFNEFDTSMLLSKSKLEQYRKVLPYNIFLCEYLGEFLDEHGDVFGDFGGVISNEYDRTNHILTAGIDWGSGVSGDYTSISIFNSFKQQVAIKYWNDLDPTQSVEQIVKILKQYNVNKVTVEYNSIGAVYYDILRKSLIKSGTHISLNKFNTTNDSKRRIIEALQVAIQNHDIQLLDDTELKLELAGYQMESTNTGKITYNGITGVHDDLIMATAICLDSMKKRSYAVR